jgi:hypothetical protein
LLSVNSVSNDIFLKSKSVKLLPIVSAEWNQNIFSTPYLTVAGTATKVPFTGPTGKTTNSITDSNKHPSFDTYSFQMTGSSDFITYTANPASASTAYKIVTYFTTSSNVPIMINTDCKGLDTNNNFINKQHGSNNAEVNSYNWTKVETYIGSIENISKFSYTINANKFSTSSENPIVYYTKPEIYATTNFDYMYGSVWPTDNVFTAFRPGESYVSTGSSSFSFPSGYRQVTNSSLLKTYTSSPFYMPVSPIVSTPNFVHSSSPLPIYKHGLMTDISAYKYFVSDNVQNPSVTGFYADPVVMNKVVVKLNTYLATTNVVVTLTKTDGSTIISNSVSPSDSGVIILYLNNGTLTTSPWDTMPAFTSSGDLNNYVSIKSITVTGQTPAPRTSTFAQSGQTQQSDLNPSLQTDMNLIQIIEISPRLEIDLTPYIIDVNVNKSLDSKQTYLPISSVVTDDATITLSSIPLGDITNPIPIFSNVSNLSSSILKNTLRKNVKFYINYNLIDYVDDSYVDQQVNKIIPGGVFYSDTWQQNDIDTISIQCYDLTRYLQTIPVSDYVANFKNAFDVISNILDLSGFTDYDIDSLYNVCNDLNSPLSLDYYFCNSKDTTLLDALNQIFLPYQIGAYVDNYGVMKFLSLSNIMGKISSSPNFNVDESIVLQNGYTINNKAKPGKISLRYQIPRLKQSLSLQNVTNADIRKGPSYIYTTSNDVVWSQQSVDAVGLNYLSADMDSKNNYFSINQSDLLDSFHTFNLNNNGYAVIEDEIVSFVYKEYKISQSSSPSVNSIVSVKNDLELAAAVSKFIKDKQIGLIQNMGPISSISHGTATVNEKTVNTTTYVVSPTQQYPLSTFKVGDLVSVTGMNPDSLNANGQVVAASGTNFTLVTSSTDALVSGGFVTKGFDYDVVVTPTGNITNVNRGMFGTNVSTHKLVGGVSGDLITNKDIKISVLNASNNIVTQSNNFTVVLTQDDPNSTTNPPAQIPYYYITGNPNSDGKVLFYSNSQIDQGYNTYSTKFNFDTNCNLASAGLFFNLDPANPDETIFLEMIKYNGSQTSQDYRYIIKLSQTISGSLSDLAWVDVTGVVISIMNNFEKLYYKNSKASKADGSDAYILYNDPHETFNLKFVKYPYINANDGEGSSGTSGYVWSVFLNNVEISGWNIWNNTNWVPTDTNTITGLRKKPVFNYDLKSNTKFGAFVSAYPNSIDNGPQFYFSYTPPGGQPTGTFVPKSKIAYIREIYASQKSLKERSVNYYFQDREFLNGLIQNQRLFNSYKEYMMQTQPEIIGINTYDVQYTNGAAVSVDILPVEYAWFYYPGNTLTEQQFVQHQIVDEYSVSYSTPINTGFRAKFALVNNSSHMVYLKKDSDELNAFVVNLNLWTHEIIAPSDPEIIEYVTDAGNIGEVVQLDSSFIQSKDSAGKLLKLISAGIDNFSKDISISIFGNPMIEVGDVISLNYPLMGINQQKYLVHGVSHTYNNGLSTKLTLNMLTRGINK